MCTRLAATFSMTAFSKKGRHTLSEWHDSRVEAMACGCLRTGAVTWRQLAELVTLLPADKTLRWMQDASDHTKLFSLVPGLGDHMEGSLVTFVQFSSRNKQSAIRNREGH